MSWVLSGKELLLFMEGATKNKYIGKRMSIFRAGGGKDTQSSEMLQKKHHKDVNYEGGTRREQIS